MTAAALKREPAYEISGNAKYWFKKEYERQRKEIAIIKRDLAEERQARVALFRALDTATNGEFERVLQLASGKTGDEYLEWLAKIMPDS